MSLLDCTDRFAPADPQHLRDPYVAYGNLLSSSRVAWHGQLESWVVTGHRECLEVLNSSDVFTCDPRRAGREVTVAPTIQLLDGEAHREVRRVLAEAMRSRNPESPPSPAARDRIDHVLTQPSFCVTNDFALPYAVDCTLDTFGIPRAIVPELRRHAQVVILSMASRIHPDAVSAGNLARLKLNELLEDAAATIFGTCDMSRLLRHQDPRDDGGSVATGSLRVAILASINSLARTLGLTVLRLMTMTGAWDGLGEVMRTGSRTQVARAVQELVRFDSAVQAVERTSVGRAALGPAIVGRGERVTLLLGAANHDPAAFDAPDRIDFRRERNPHLGWGWGDHVCLGKRIALAHLIPALELLVGSGRFVVLEEPVFDENPSLRGLKRLIVGRDPTLAGRPSSGA